MAKARDRERSWFGWALCVLAALTLVVATPQHMLDLDEAAGPAAELVVHGHAHTLIDHGQPGHACAGHCAAHVMADASFAAVLTAPSPRPLIWATAETRDGRAPPSSKLDRPPKA
ncbi:MAG: hypothetical protein ACXU8Q_06625 [Caulobacteraceae bacterium]